MSDRPTWDEYFIQMATLASTRSPCERLHVGCILTKDSRVISQAYNGYLPGCPHEQILAVGPDNKSHEMATVHAEQNAITDCAKRGVSCANSTAYITHYPCINCMKMLCAAGIKDIKYSNDYYNDPLVPYFSKVSGVPVKKMPTVQNFLDNSSLCGFILDDQVKSPPSLFISSSKSPELSYTSSTGEDIDIFSPRRPTSPKSPGIKGSQPIFPMPHRT